MWCSYSDFNNKYVRLTTKHTYKWQQQQPYKTIKYTMFMGVIV